MKSKPDIQDFLAGAEGEPQREELTVKVVPPEQTVVKSYRMKWSIAARLKITAIEESAGGRKVTETEIVERALRKELGME